MKLLKRFWRFLKNPAKAAAGLVLVLGFVGGVMFWGGFNWGMELTNTETFCAGCHQNLYEEIQDTIHFTNRSGVRAICSDCHVPHEFGPKMLRSAADSDDITRSPNNLASRAKPLVMPFCRPYLIV